MVRETREGGWKRGILPAPRDPTGHVHDAHGAQRLDQGQRRAVELPEHLVAFEQILARLLGLLVEAAGDEPQVLDGWAHQTVVEVDQHRTGRPENVAVMEVPVDAL